MATLPNQHLMISLILFLGLFMLMITLNNINTNTTSHIDIPQGGNARRHLIGQQDEEPLEPERSGPSPGAGHDVQGSRKTKIGIMGGKQERSLESGGSGPSAGAGTGAKGSINKSRIRILSGGQNESFQPDRSGPSPGAGHDVQGGSKNTRFGITSGGQNGSIEPEKSGPSPGAGHDIQGSWKSGIRITSGRHDESPELHTSVPSPGVGHYYVQGDPMNSSSEPENSGPSPNTGRDILGSRKIGIGITGGGHHPKFQGLGKTGVIPVKNGGPSPGQGHGQEHNLGTSLKY